MLPPLTVAVDLRALVPAPTGIGVYTRSLLGALARGGTGRYLGWSHQPVQGAEELERLGVDLETQSAPLGFLWQQIRVPARVRQRRPSVFWSPLMTLPWRLDVPGVVTIHDLTVLTHPETHTAKVRLSIRPLLRRTLHQAATVVAISRATKKDLERFFPEVREKVVVVYNGVDPIFRPPTEAELDGEIAALREEIGCPGGYLLYVGTLEPRKNVGAILDAWEALRRLRPQTPPLVLAGAAGWRNRALLQRIEALKEAGLKSLGHLDRLRLLRLIQGATVFLYPSLSEGFGLPPVEAMACGVPTVVSNVSSLPEVVSDAGLQVPPDSPGALAQAVRSILEDEALRRRLTCAGPQRARRFSWDRAAREMERIFRDAAAGPLGEVPLNEPPAS